jgi:hypothetical protein
LANWFFFGGSRAVSARTPRPIFTGEESSSFERKLRRFVAGGGWATGRGPQLMIWRRWWRRLSLVGSLNGQDTGGFATLAAGGQIQSNTSLLAFYTSPSL